ncbi:MAG: DUF333 domain-containing protein [Patescibacteria group bacterium]
MLIRSVSQKLLARVKKQPLIFCLVGLAMALTPLFGETKVFAQEQALSNPASEYCLNNNGTLNIRQESNGEVGYCQFDDGSECEEWAYFRQECQQGTNQVDQTEKEPDSGSNLGQKSQLSAEIEDLKETYRGQLREYRDKEKVYTIAVDQYRKLGTLESIEKAVTATRELMITRDQVLQTHFRLLRLYLLDTAGVEESFKKEWLSVLETNIEELDKSQQQLATTTDRVKLNELSIEFKKKNQIYKKNSLSVSVVLTAARLQNFYDRQVLLRNDIEKYLEKSDLGIDASTRRSFIETDRVLKKAQDSLAEYWQRLARSQAKGQLDGNYNNLNRDLNPVYVSLAQGMSYLDEIMTKND